MPNWCNNGLTLRHEDPAMIDRALKSLADARFLQEFVPCPQDLIDTVAGYVGDEKQAAHEAQQARNLELYGNKDWYDWCLDNWGTKWDVGGDDGLMQKLDDNTLQASFESAWSPPIEAYRKLTEQGFHVTAFYYEPGMSFVGKWDSDGEDFSCDISSYSSDTVREAIGEELDDYWNISEELAQYEEDEA